MGVMSRRVVPACGSICCFCPSLRASSRQPVKRYKKLLADIFPPNQDAEPNDRKIGKLCEYLSRNPLRIPKIADNLEQRCYKDLRCQNFGSVKVIICIYRKLLSSCKEQMPLFGSSLLVIIRTLLEQFRDDEMRILGCSTLVDLINCELDSTYMFNLEGFIPKLCELAQEEGDEERAIRLRSAGLQAISSMIVLVMLENYMNLHIYRNGATEGKQCSTDENQQGDGHHKAAKNEFCPPEINKKESCLVNVVTGPERDPNLEAVNSPCYWSRVCLRNYCRLVKQAASKKCVFEPLLHNFDVENHWFPEKGIAYSVLTYFQSLFEESGDNPHLLLSILAKHLDHKNVVKQPRLQIDIVNVTTQLAHSMKQQASNTTIGAICDMIKQLRKCLQSASELSSTVDDAFKLCDELKLALERCISEMSNKVGDAGPILDMMSVLLENISTTTSTIIARTTTSAVYQTSKIISGIPNKSYHKKAFPDALFHQLLLAMAHPDHETRVGAHSIFSMVLIPSLYCPQSNRKVAASQKVKSESFSIHNEDNGEAATAVGELEGLVRTDAGVESRVAVSHGYNLINAFSDGSKELSSLRLSSHQVSLLLSSIWVQATSAENYPTNFEAMAHTYSITLLFTRSKTSSYKAFVRCFQLAFSLRSVSLNDEGFCPSRRRSLFTLASYMLLFTARTGNVPHLIPMIKASLTERTVDPFLELVDDVRLQIACREPYKGNMSYASQEDEIAALGSLAAVDSDDKNLKEAVMSYFTTNFPKLTEDELSSIRKQVGQGFSPDDAYPIGPPLFSETPGPCSPLAPIKIPNFDTDMLAVGFTDEISIESIGKHSDLSSSASTSHVDILSVNQLLESVLETARQVASVHVSMTPVPYDQMKNQCEALVTGKQEKMSVLHSFKHQQETKAIIALTESETILSPPSTKTMEFPEGELKLVTVDQVIPQNQVYSCSREYGHQHSFKLPPSSPYDKFLKAAGCG